MEILYCNLLERVFGKILYFAEVEILTLSESKGSKELKFKTEDRSSEPFGHRRE